MSEKYEKLRQQYLERGYCVLKGFWDVSRLEAINRDIHDLFRAQARRFGLPVAAGETREAFRDNAVAVFRRDVPTYVNTARMAQSLPSVHQLLTDEKLVGLAKVFGVEMPILCAKPSIHFMAEALKVPGGYSRTPPHQDWRSMQGSIDSIVMWMPTVPVPATSSPMQFAIGSHRLGLLDTVDHIMTPMVSDPRVTEESYVDIPAEPGDVVLFSSFMVHRTSESDDGLVRIALSTRFNNGLEPSFVEHGYPTPYKFSYRLDLMYENFPSQADIDRVFPPA